LEVLAAVLQAAVLRVAVLQAADSRDEVVLLAVEVPEEVRRDEVVRRDAATTIRGDVVVVATSRTTPTGHRPRRSNRWCPDSAKWKC
jgi:hypothetical protein